MSADDYIFVLETPAECSCGGDKEHAPNCSVAWGTTEWRVRHITGGYWENEEEMIAAFTQPGTPIFYDKAQALLRAHDLMDEHDHAVEYGVRLIRAEQSILRPTLRPEPQDV